jgi:UDP-N-acetylglucosamine kinase
MDHTAWANKYKKRIAREFIRETDFTKSEIPAGIFTAGLPGAGKTEFTVELLKGISTKPVRIDMDEIAQLVEGYRPEIADKFRAGASNILGKIYDEVIKSKIDFVFDGTFSHGRSLENVERALHHGYTVKVYYVHQEPLVAWKFTQDREVLEHRAIDKAGFIETYIKLEQNLRNLCKNYKDVTISLIVKDAQNKEGRRVENVENLFDEIPDFLTREQLESVLS